MSTLSSIETYGEIVKQPTQIYGQGPLKLRVGNGGAGATGLIEALVNGFNDGRDESTWSVSWICNHSRNTQLALLRNYIDIALTYEREQEAIAQEEGWSVTHGCVFHDHFCLAGPIEDPANVTAAETVQEAFKKIARAQSLFHSRADFSATMSKERSIWNSLGIHPFSGAEDASKWYLTSHLSPAEAVKAADSASAYLLTDRSTLLRQVANGDIQNTTVFFEPISRDDILMNSCYALHRPHPPNEVLSFLNYVDSYAGQEIIAKFGEVETGLPLFSPVGDERFKNNLKLGRPRNRRWERD